jgi:hypothetical protein
MISLNKRRIDFFGKRVISFGSVIESLLTVRLFFPALFLLALLLPACGGSKKPFRFSISRNVLLLISSESSTITGSMPNG